MFSFRYITISSTLGRVGGGQVVSGLALYSNDLSLNPVKSTDSVILSFVRKEPIEKETHLNC